MLNIKKVNSPEFYEKAIEKHRPQNWEKFGSLKNHEGSIKTQLRDYILQNEQKINDNYYCTYCERNIIENSSHIDHIKPKHLFHELEFDYNNFTISCESTDTCGHKKDRQDNKDLLHPVVDNPEDFINYSFTGEISSKKDSKRVDITCKIYNLNQKDLLNERKSVIELLVDYGNQLSGFIDSLQENFQFPTLIKWYREENGI